jgi:hypothetical protein
MKAFNKHKRNIIYLWTQSHQVASLGDDDSSSSFGRIGELLVSSLHVERYTFVDDELRETSSLVGEAAAASEHVHGSEFAVVSDLAIAYHSFAVDVT